MEDLNIKQTISSPKILTNYVNKTIIIKGDSYPENPFSFYEPLVEFLQEYIKTQDTLNLSIELSYYGSSTTKILYDLFNMLNESKMDIEIKWNYDSTNEFSLENGANYSEDYPNLNIQLVEV